MATNDKCSLCGQSGGEMIYHPLTNTMVHKSCQQEAVAVIKAQLFKLTMKGIK